MVARPLRDAMPLLSCAWDRPLDFGRCLLGRFPPLGNGRQAIFPTSWHV